MTREEIMLDLYNKGESLTAIAKVIGVSKARAGQIFAVQGFSITDRKKLEHDLIINNIAAYIAASPTASIAEYYREFPKTVRLSSVFINSELKKRGISINKSAIISAALSSARRGGRVELTKEFLHEEYVVNNKTQKQIAAETGYSQSVLSKWTRTYGYNKETA